MEAHLPSELAVAMAAAALAVIVLWWIARPLRSLPRAALAMTGALTVLVAARAGWRRQDGVLGNVLPAATGGGFVSAGACATCHPDQAASWRDTYHRTMTQAAGRESILAPFAGERLEDRGLAFVVESRGTAFYAHEVAPLQPEGGGAVVTAPGGAPASPLASHRIVLTTGSHHQQNYWFRDDAGHLRSLPWVWLVAEERWIPNADSFLVAPHWAAAAGAGRWDDNCYRCHSTGWSRDAASDGDHVSITDLGIACEACHGPGEAHVRVNQNPLRRWRLRFSGGGDATIVNAEKLDPQRSAAVCAQCHSESFIRIDPEQGLHLVPFRPGQTHEERFLAKAPLRLHRASRERDITRPRLAGAFWPDGTARVAGREHSAMMLSQCHEAGTLSCISCHSMHDAPPDRQVRRSAQGDAACSPCHEAIVASPRDHTHHEPGSSGSLCVNCHMPHTTYGLFAARRSHRLDSPAPRGVDDSARPNPCNLCHLDRTLAWTARWLEAWYAIVPPGLPEHHREVAASVVWALRGDAAQRAVVAWHLGWPVAREISGSDWMTPVLAQLLEDPYAAVRFIAARSLFGDRWTGEGYDFVASPEARRAAARKVLEAWQRRAPPAELGRPAVLLGEGGALDVKRVAALVAERNHSPIGITE